MRICHGFLCASILLLHVCIAGSGEPPKRERRVDEFGDELPDRAIARIGTVRLRQPSEVCSVVWSPDGKLLATGGRYDGVRIWNADTGTLVRFVPASRGQGIFHIAFTHDSKTLVSASNGELDVWDVATGKKTHRLVKDSPRLGPLRFSDDGKLLAIADGSGMRVWETTDWTAQIVPVPSDKILFPSFVGKPLFVQGLRNADNVFWNLASMQKKPVPSDWRTGYATLLSPDGKQIAVAGGNDPFVQIREVATGKLVQLRELPKEKDTTITSLCYSPDGIHLAIGGRNVETHCIDVATGKETAKFGDQIVDYATQFAFSPDGKRLAAAHQHAVRIWDVATGKELLHSTGPEGGIRSIAISPDGKRLAYSSDKMLRLHDLLSRKSVWRMETDWQDGDRLAFSPDGKSLVGGNVSLLRFRDATNGKVTHSWGNGLPSSVRPGDGIEFGTCTPDFDKVVSMYLSNAGNPSVDVVIQNAKSGKELLKFQRRGDSARAARVSPNGQLLAIGGQAEPIHLYNLATGKWMMQVEIAGTDWYRLDFALDGRALVSFTDNDTLEILEVATGKSRRSIKLELNSREHFAFGANGRMLAIWQGSSVHLWDPLSGRKFARLQGHTGYINQAAFLPDGRTLVTASEDATILFWDVSDLVHSEKLAQLSPDDLASDWNSLAELDAAKACVAMARLRRAGPQAVEFLRERLRPTAVPDAKDVAAWLKALDGADFAARTRATKELQTHADVLASSLQKALAASPSLEAQRRLTQLIENADRHWTADALRTLRAMEVLEHIGTKEARAVLETVAKGAPDGRLTRDAKAALERLTR